MVRIRTLLIWGVLACLLAIYLPLAHAVVYSYDSDTSTATYKTTEPTSSDITNWTTGWGTTSTGSSVTGWDYVGTINGASGVYLGNGWVIACAHEGISTSSTYTLNGVDYSVTSVTTIGTTDIVLFQISSIIDLPSLTISSTLPTLGTSIVMIGNGGGAESWGVNTIVGKNYPSTPTDTSYVTTTFYSASTGTSSYAIVGDSGGAAFTYNSTTHSWVLAGIMESVGSSTSDGITTNYTFYTQLSTYYTEISSIMATAIPENSTLAMLVVGCMAFLGIHTAKKRFVIR